MTVVAWDGKTLAADKRTSFGGLHATTTKVHRANGALLAGCGVTAQVVELLCWYRAGCNPATFPEIQRDAKESVSLLAIQPGGLLLQWETTPYPLVLENKQWAIGSGRDFAIMAMHLGKTAREAVELACVFDSNSGNGVDSMDLEVLT